MSRYILLGTVVSTPVSKSLYARVAPWCIWGLAAFFFFAHYVVRVTPGHISEDLLDHFIDTTKVSIGILGAAFYLPYVLMQMPVGYLVDRFGTRSLLTLAVLICSVSCLFFANASIIDTAIFSRVLLGFCSAAAFISALKLITVWFEPQKLALLVGVTQALGMVGAAFGARLVPYLNQQIGWQDTFYGYSIVFFALAILIFAVVRNAPANGNASIATPSPSAKPAGSMLSVLFSKYTWINACYAGAIYAPTDVMGELWGKEFLKNIHSLNNFQASHAVSYIFIGWAIGGPIAGWLADHYGRRPIMIASALLGLILLPILFYVPFLPLFTMNAVAFFYGLTNTGLIASYTVAGELHDKSHGGFSMAIANMFSVLLGAAFMPLLAWLLERLASIGPDGVVIYSPEDYQKAVFILPICLLIAVVLAVCSKETLKPKVAKAI